LIPYRIDLAGGWLDQPYISGLYPGWVITLSLAPIQEYKERCGMATSTRKSMNELFKLGLPNIDSIELAKLVFNYDNKPGAKNISGAQDAIGLCMKGLTRHYYNGKYWPQRIEICQDEAILQWLENIIFLQLTYPRPDNLDILKKINIDIDLIKILAECSDNCWNAIMNKDIDSFGDYLYRSFEVQKLLFPLMNIDYDIPKCKGHKIAGAGGGGYLIMVNNTPCGDKIKVSV
jgi:hypothetical protein